MAKILIIGAGSIGALIGAALVQAGYQIVFAGKPGSNYTQTLKQQGLQLYYPDHTRLWISPIHPQVKFVDTATNLQQKFDLMIIALKSNYLSTVISFIHSHATPKTILIHAQNGIPYWWFNCDRYLASLNHQILTRLPLKRNLSTVDPGGMIARNLSQYQSVGCVVKAPCQKNAAGKIQVKKPPKLILGCTQEKSSGEVTQVISHLSQIFCQQKIEASYTDKIRTAVCQKLAINLTTNVLSALTGKVIADVTNNFASNYLIPKIVTEVNLIFAAYGIPPIDLPTSEQIYSYIKTPGSQSHLPSLAQDFAQHRQGEINLITAPVEMANIAQLKMPILASLSELLQIAQIHSLNSNTQAYQLSLDDVSGYCGVDLGS